MCNENKTQIPFIFKNNIIGLKGCGFMQELKIGSTFPYAEDLGLLVGTDSCGYHYQGDLGLDMLVIAYNGVTKKSLIHSEKPLLP